MFTTTNITCHVQTSSSKCKPIDDILWLNRRASAVQYNVKLIFISYKLKMQTSFGIRRENKKGEKSIFPIDSSSQSFNNYIPSIARDSSAEHTHFFPSRMHARSLALAFSEVKWGMKFAQNTEKLEKLKLRFSLLLFRYLSVLWLHDFILKTIQPSSSSIMLKYKLFISLLFCWLWITSPFIIAVSVSYFMFCLALNFKS